MMEGVTGAILAGGESRRFGSDKALAPWDGKTLVESVAGVLANIFPANLILSKEPRAFEFLGKPALRVVKDMLEERHPMGGLWSSLHYAETESVFVCACDMPLLQPRLVRGLGEARHGYDAVVPVWRGTPRPLCGIYSKKCRGVIDRLIKDGRLDIGELFGILHTRFYLEKEIAALDPDGLSFVDIDTREEYEAAKRKTPC